jgi:hypothetical protein
VSNLPSDSAFADGSSLSKSVIRALFSQRVPQSVSGPGELRALTTGGANTFLVRSANQFFWCDAADHTSGDDGASVIVSADGYRYKAIVPSVSAGSIATAHLANAAVSTAKLQDGSATFAKLDSGIIASASDGQAGTSTSLLMTPAATDAAIKARLSGGLAGTPQILLSPVSDVRFTFPDLADPVSNRIFRIHFYNVLPSVNNTYLCMQFSQDGGTTFIDGSSDYIACDNHGAQTTYSYMQLAQLVRNISGYEMSGTIDIFDPLTPGTRKSVLANFAYNNNSGNFDVGQAGGQLDTTNSACNACRLFFTNGSHVKQNTASGTFFMTSIYF